MTRSSRTSTTVREKNVGDMAHVFREWSKLDKERKRRNLKNAERSTLKWMKHTKYHWSIMVGEDRLDYWPSRDKFRYKGHTYHGGVDGFVRRKMTGLQESSSD